jgi:hypothetical protein
VASDARIVALDEAEAQQRERAPTPDKTGGRARAIEPSSEPIVADRQARTCVEALLTSAAELVQRSNVPGQHAAGGSHVSVAVLVMHSNPLARSGLVGRPTLGTPGTLEGVRLIAFTPEESYYSFSGIVTFSGTFEGGAG